MVAVVVTALPQFRPMLRTDLAAVAAIEAAAYEFPWSQHIFRDCLDAGHKCWVLESDHGVIGYGVLSTGADEAHILNLCVAPAEQGHGHGGRLLYRLLDLARWHSAHRVFLEVRPSNVAAQGMYERAGFNEIGRRPNYYPARRGREDAIVMAMELFPSSQG
ncbi:MAG: ribosomal protein S18-alanine N-acetyltransferase [Rhodanobacteraceae bacterium]